MCSDILAARKIRETRETGPREVHLAGRALGFLLAEKCRRRGDIASRCVRPAAVLLVNLASLGSRPDNSLLRGVKRPLLISYPISHSPAIMPPQLPICRVARRSFSLSRLFVFLRTAGAVMLYYSLLVSRFDRIHRDFIRVEGGIRRLEESLRTRAYISGKSVLNIARL